MSPTPPQRVLLMGMMGAGKTTVGAALSKRTGWPYLDNDTLVARAGGRSTDKVLDEEGVDTLRDLESRALTEALRAPVPVIAAVAGGIVDSDDDRRRLAAGGFVVWLRASIETLAQRVGTGEGRPWFHEGDDVATALRRLYDGRADRYAAVASYIVDVDDLSPEQIADRICTAMSHERPEDR